MDGRGNAPFTIHASAIWGIWHTSYRHFSNSVTLSGLVGDLAGVAYRSLINHKCVMSLHEIRGAVLRRNPYTFTYELRPLRTLAYTTETPCELCSRALSLTLVGLREPRPDAPPAPRAATGSPRVPGVARFLVRWPRPIRSEALCSMLPSLHSRTELVETLSAYGG